MTRVPPAVLPLCALLCMLAAAGCTTTASGRTGPSGPYVSGGAGYETR